MFTEGKINGVEIIPLAKYTDTRGWLMEFYRKDKMDKEIFPMMSYISMTRPNVVRGPHNHKEQTDYFCFPGPSNFNIFTWDYREDSSTYLNKLIINAGEDNPSILIIPPGVVHAYKNIGSKDGFVINSPNKLYKGWDNKEPVDEVRFEDDIHSPFKYE